MHQLKQFRKKYNPYYDLYLNNLDDEDDLNYRLNANLDLVYNFFDKLDNQQFAFSYNTKKWTVFQILQHIIDTERVFCYRALKIVREKQPEIESYNHEDYAKKTSFKSKTIHLEDYKNNRLASLALFKSFTSQDLKQCVEFGQYKFCVGLIPFIFCGHELHHLKVIESKYF